MADDKVYYQGSIDFESKEHPTITVHAPKDGSGESRTEKVQANRDILSITNMPSASEITISHYLTGLEVSRVKLLTTHHPSFLNKTVDALTYSHLLSIAKEGQFVEYGLGIKVIEVWKQSRAEEHPQSDGFYWFDCTIKVSEAPPTAS